jgi:hypothetical protein
MQINHIQFLIIEELQKALTQNNVATIEQVIIEHGMEKILDKDVINTARVINARETVIFLCTIGAERNPKESFYQNLLVIYRLIKNSIHPADAIINYKCAKNEREFFKFIIDTISTRGENLPHPNINYNTTSENYWIAIQYLCDADLPNTVMKLFNHWAKIDTTEKPWLYCSKLIIERSEFAKAKILKTEYGTLLETLLERTPKSQMGIKPIIQATLLDKILIPNLDKDKSLLISKELIKTNKSIEYRSLYMRSLLINHNFVEAIEICNELIEESANKKIESKAQDIDPKKQHSINEDKFNPHAAELSLKKINNSLRSKGLKPFLISGTLLGCMREKSIMTHDKDLDLGIIGWQSQFDLANTLIEMGHFDINLHELSGEKLFLLTANDLLHNVTIDFFIFHDKGDHFLHGIEYQDGFTQNFKFSKFNLIDWVFLNEKFYVPDNWDLMLSENYGLWDQKIENYVVTVESPAIVDKGSLKHQMLASLEIFKTIYNDLNHKRVKRILDYSKTNKLELVPNHINSIASRWIEKFDKHLDS